LRFFLKEGRLKDGGFGGGLTLAAAVYGLVVDMKESREGGEKEVPRKGTTPLPKSEMRRYLGGTEGGIRLDSVGSVALMD